MCIGCQIREQVREADRRRRETRMRFHAEVNAQLAKLGLPLLEPPSLAQLRTDLETYPELRSEFAHDRLERRHLLRVALRVQRLRGCSGAREGRSQLGQAA
ncbi:MAG: hypothetical protein ACXVZP_09930 [Gaiellaceae bacterium]